MPEPLHPETVSILINGANVQVPSTATVAVALALAGELCRISVRGEPRGPLCAMGICYECRVIIDGSAHRLACQTICAPGMKVSTSE